MALRFRTVPVQLPAGAIELDWSPRDLVPAVWRWAAGSGPRSCDAHSIGHQPPLGHSRYQMITGTPRLMRAESPSKTVVSRNVNWTPMGPRAHRECSRSLLLELFSRVNTGYPLKLSKTCSATLDSSRDCR
jgi:hypothetical protein